MWIKEILVDILVTLFIIATIWLDEVWMWYVLIAYTALLLIAKAAVLSGDIFLQMIRKTRQESPVWIPYLLYLANTLLLLRSGRWYLAGAWALMGLLSWLAQRKIDGQKAH